MLQWFIGCPKFVEFIELPFYFGRAPFSSKNVLFWFQRSCVDFRLMTELAEATSRAGTMTLRTGNARSSCMEAVRVMRITSGRKTSAKTFAVVSISTASCMKNIRFWLVRIFTTCKQSCGKVMFLRCLPFCSHEFCLNPACIFGHMTRLLPSGVLVPGEDLSNRGSASGCLSRSSLYQGGSPTPMIRSLGERHASYWNAFLFIMVFYENFFQG